MIDANQRWDVQEAIDRVTALKEFKPLWVGLSAQTIFQIGVEFFTLLRHLQPRNIIFFRSKNQRKMMISWDMQKSQAPLNRLEYALQLGNNAKIELFSNN